MKKSNLKDSTYSTIKMPQTQYLGSKQRLVDWIYENTPREVDTIFDAFSGTSVVGFHYKKNGKRVIGNDFLKFNYHIGKALIVNKSDTLTDLDLQLLFSENSNKGNLIEDVFTGVFFESEDAVFLDNFRANVPMLSNANKQSLAFAIMCRALTRKILLGHFAHTSALRYSKDPQRIKVNPSIARPVKDLFIQLHDGYNKAIFDNGKSHKFYNEDTVELVKKLKGVDLAYFDPPYCGCHPDYQAFYHFLETFVEYWDDKEFINGTKHYFPKKESGFVKKTDVVNSFNNLFSASTHIPYWLISYNSKSYPNKEEMINLLSQYKKVEVVHYEYENNYGGKGSKKGTHEYLFFCHD